MNTYTVGCLVMFYEIEMLEEYVDSIINATDGMTDKSRITAHFCLNMQQYLERMDAGRMSQSQFVDRAETIIDKLDDIGINVVVVYKTDNDPWFNIAAYRRNLCADYCTRSTFVIWGETDSLFPQSMFNLIDAAHTQLQSSGIHKYILNFGDRANWDPSWKSVTHPMFTAVEYIDNQEWMLNNEASSKSYMTMERMNEINAMSGDVQLRILREPKFDGSCLVITSELIKSGVNIPPGIIHCGEDTALGVMAKQLLQGAFVQICAFNILRVHNRRHPRKRMYILDEDNPRGLCGEAKGFWWDILERASKENLNNLFSQSKLNDEVEVIKNITTPLKPR